MKKLSLLACLFITIILVGCNSENEQTTTVTTTADIAFNHADTIVDNVLYSYDSENNCYNIKNIVDNSVTYVSLRGQVNSLSVKKIENSAFNNCVDITSITIPEGITAVGNSAFSYCGNLQSVVFPTTLTSIGYSAFYNCRKLNNITLPAISSIEEETFYNCEGLTSITIPNNVIELKDRAFTNCKKLKTVTFSNSTNLTSIGVAAFKGCTALERINLPTSVTNIDTEAFYNCSSLKSIYISSQATRISQNIFNLCEQIVIYFQSSAAPAGFNIENGVYYNVNEVYSSNDLEYIHVNDEIIITRCLSSATNITIPQTLEGKPVKIIGDNAFRGCETLLTINLPNQLVSIGESSFASCEVLKTIAFPNSLNKIKANAFNNCIGLQYIHIPSNLQMIDGPIFPSCSNLIIYVNNSSEPSGWDEEWHNERPVYFDVEVINDSDGMQYLVSGGEVIITRYIGSSQTLTIPSTINSTPITAIGDYAFSRANTLSVVNISATNADFESIGKNAFYYCENLTNVSLPNSTSEIGGYAFAFTGLSSINMPSGITVLATSLFAGCQELETVTLGSVETISEGAFSGCIRLTIVQLPNTLTSIGVNAFYDCMMLVAINIPSSVLSIGSSAFANCTDLTITCECAAIPPTWDNNWNPSNCTVRFAE